MKCCYSKYQHTWVTSNAIRTSCVKVNNMGLYKGTNKWVNSCIDEWYANGWWIDSQMDITINEWIDKQVSKQKIINELIDKV